MNDTCHPNRQVGHSAMPKPTDYRAMLREQIDAGMRSSPSYHTQGGSSHRLAELLALRTEQGLELVRCLAARSPNAC